MELLRPAKPLLVLPKIFSPTVIVRDGKGCYVSRSNFSRDIPSSSSGVSRDHALARTEYSGSPCLLDLRKSSAAESRQKKHDITSGREACRFFPYSKPFNDCVGRCSEEDTLRYHGYGTQMGADEECRDVPVRAEVSSVSPGYNDNTLEKSPGGTSIGASRRLETTPFRRSPVSCERVTSAGTWMPPYGSTASSADLPAGPSPLSLRLAVSHSKLLRHDEPHSPSQLHCLIATSGSAETQSSLTTSYKSSSCRMSPCNERSTVTRPWNVCRCCERCILHWVTTSAGLERHEISKNLIEKYESVGTFTSRQQPTGRGNHGDSQNSLCAPRLPVSEYCKVSQREDEDSNNHWHDQDDSLTEMKSTNSTSTKLTRGIRVQNLNKDNHLREISGNFPSAKTIGDPDVDFRPSLSLAASRKLFVQSPSSCAGDVTWDDANLSCYPSRVLEYRGIWTVIKANNIIHDPANRFPHAGETQETTPHTTILHPDFESRSERNGDNCGSLKYMPVFRGMDLQPGYRERRSGTEILEEKMSPLTRRDVGNFPLAGGCLNRQPYCEEPYDLSTKSAQNTVPLSNPVRPESQDRKIRSPLPDHRLLCLEKCYPIAGHFLNPKTIAQCCTSRACEEGGYHNPRDFQEDRKVGSHSPLTRHCVDCTEGNRWVDALQSHCVRREGQQTFHSCTDVPVCFQTKDFKAGGHPSGLNAEHSAHEALKADAHASEGGTQYSVTRSLWPQSRSQNVDRNAWDASSKGYFPCGLSETQNTHFSHAPSPPRETGNEFSHSSTAANLNYDLSADPTTTLPSYLSDAADQGSSLRATKQNYPLNIPNHGSLLPVCLTSNSTSRIVSGQTLSLPMILEERHGCYNLPPSEFAGREPSVPGEDSVLATQQHLRSGQRRRRTRLRTFQCSMCPVACSNRGQLRGHLRTHTGERPFPCPEPGCKKTFVRNEELTRHRRIHSGERPYPCTTCRKAFTRKDHLNKHLRMHADSTSASSEPAESGS